jgi:hypothetical protein
VGLNGREGVGLANWCAGGLVSWRAGGAVKWRADDAENGRAAGLETPRLNPSADFSGLDSLDLMPVFIVELRGLNISGVPTVKSSGGVSNARISWDASLGLDRPDWLDLFESKYPGSTLSPITDNSSGERANCKT